MPRPSQEDVELGQDLAASTSKSIPSKEQLVKGDHADAGGDGEASPESAIHVAPGSSVARWRFWAVFASLCSVMFLSALDSTVITIALPTISRSLESTQYAWVVNGYALSCCVCLLIMGQLADVLDRKPIVLASVLLFGGGSAICGAAQSMGMMIAGRVIQGVGGGGIAVLSEVVCSDMVSLEERSKYLGLLLALAALGTVVGPSIGGGIVAHTTWRWIFYINLPLSGFSLAFLLLVLKPQTPGLAAARLRLAQKLQTIDWIGNTVFAGSSTALLYGLITGGNEHPWRSVSVILPLVIGVIGLGIFGWYEGIAKHPVAPPRLFNNRTALALHLLALFVVLVLTWSSYFLPVYFQAVLETSASRASVLLLPTVLTPMPFSVVGGMLVAIFKRAREIHMLAAAVMAVSFGIFTLFDAQTSLAVRVVMQTLSGASVGLLVASILPALQAQLPESDVAAVTALFNFMRALGGVWGVTIPSVVFNARVSAGLGGVDDAALRDRLADGGAFALASAEFIKTLSGEIKDQVVDLYVSSLRVTWYVAMALSVGAFVLACSEKRVEIKSGKT